MCDLFIGLCLVILILVTFKDEIIDIIQAIKK